MTEQLRVLVADDHAPTRAGVRLALEGQGFAICAEASDAPGAVEAAEDERPDICLLDIRMPGSGIAAAAQISSRVPGSVIVMLTVSRDDVDLYDALRAGAAGYLLKDIDPGRLPYALRGVVAGETALPRELVGKLVGEFDARARRRGILRGRKHPAELTEREWEVLDQLHAGHATAEIAERLGIAPVTVRRHVSQIMRKLRVTDRKEALRLLERGDDG